MPAKAGIHCRWIPAFAGMTKKRSPHVMRKTYIRTTPVSTAFISKAAAMSACV